MNTRPAISLWGYLMVVWWIMCWGYDAAIAAFAGFSTVSLHGGSDANAQRLAYALLASLFCDTALLFWLGTSMLRGARANALYATLRLLWIVYAFVNAMQMIPHVERMSLDDHEFVGYLIMLLGVLLNFPTVLFHLRMLFRGQEFRNEVAAMFEPAQHGQQGRGT